MIELTIKEVFLAFLAGLLIGGTVGFGYCQRLFEKALNNPGDEQ